MITKKIIFSVLFTALIAGTSFTQETEPNKRKNHEISVNPLGLVTFSLPINYRIALTDSVALGVNAEGSQFSWGKSEHWSFGGGVSAKFFLSGNVFEDGWFVEPRFNAYYSYWDGTKFWGIKPSAIAGYSWVWNSGFTINLALGAGYGINFVDSKLFAKKSYGIKGIMPAGEFGLGWAW